MKRVKIQPRENYKEKIEELGFNFHTDYWKEEAYYSFTRKEIETIESASNECYSMICKAVQYLIDHDRVGDVYIPENVRKEVIESWERDDLSLYGRFDFAMIPDSKTGELVPKLLEFNAQTPTSLLEAAIIQWDWIKQVFPGKDQFNTIHEALVQSWKDIKKETPEMELVHFACSRENVEDEETTQYIVSTAMEAGLDTAEIELEQLGWDEENKVFWDPSNRRIDYCFALYPFEWMFYECPEGVKGDIIWFEPLWKSMMSNKAILITLSELFPDSPYILKCKDTPVGMKDNYCKKPIFSREGANISLFKDGDLLEKSVDEGYGEEGYVYQQLVDIPEFDGKYPIIGSWIIGGESVGMGIRETSSRITDNMSEFIPHIIED